MEVWISKYALTQNIYLETVEQNVSNTSMVYRENSSANFHGEGREWHRTQEGAIAKAEQMRQRKIASLKKSITKLEKMKFG